MKIVSGGQTGVDRAALDVALIYGIDCNGWCPAGRMDERGRIPERYPVKELPNGGFAERTSANVRDSDGTVIFHCGKLSGGTERTVQCCAEHKRPRLLLDAQIIAPSEAGRVIKFFVQKAKIGTLNVAGPRQSEWPEGYDYAAAALANFFDAIACSSSSVDAAL